MLLYFGLKTLLTLLTRRLQFIALKMHQKPSMSFRNNVNHLVHGCFNPFLTSDANLYMQLLEKAIMFIYYYGDKHYVSKIQMPCNWHDYIQIVLVFKIFLYFGLNALLTLLIERFQFVVLKVHQKPAMSLSSNVDHLLNWYFNLFLTLNTSF